MIEQDMVQCVQKMKFWRSGGTRNILKYSNNNGTTVREKVMLLQKSKVIVGNLRHSLSVFVSLKWERPESNNNIAFTYI